MKKILLIGLVLVTFQIKAQQQQIQILLVDAEVGYPIGQPDVPPYYEAVSNDPGLNAIFQMHNATHYYPGYETCVEFWQGRVHYVLCEGCDVNQFESDLQNYSAAIEKTYQTEPYSTANTMYVKLWDGENGNPTGNTTPEGIIITTNSEINEIFIDHTVLCFERAFPTTTNPELMKVYNLECDCYAEDLGPALEALVDVVEYTERKGFVILETSDFSKLDFTIVPNPTNNTIKVQTSESIELYTLMDILGNHLLETPTLEALNELLPTLASGTYFLQVRTTDHRSSIYKLLKK